MEHIAKELEQVEAQIAEEIDQADGYWPEHIYSLIAKAQQLAAKLR